MNARVLAPGLLTTVQDRGRIGHRHLGVARAGALDPGTAALANRLVGNPDDAAVLEITLHGPTLQLPRPAGIALLGAELEMRFEGTLLPAGRPIALPPGTLRLGNMRAGIRAWLAFAGGIGVAPVLGSRSTDLRGGFGGLHGRALRAGDLLPLADADAASTQRGHADGLPDFPHWWIDPEVDPGIDAPIRFVASRHPAAAGLAEIRWRVDPHSDRQGLRLVGSGLDAGEGSGISEPVAPGTIQLPPDGHPIVLLADAQTVGGYPTLGYVIGRDLPRLAQLGPHARLRLAACGREQAWQLGLDARRQLARLRLAITDRLGLQSATGVVAGPQAVP